jgi:hypothetical protein
MIGVIAESSSSYVCGADAGAGAFFSVGARGLKIMNNADLRKASAAH